MEEKQACWLATFFATVALILVVVNVTMALGNRSLQADASARQTAVNGAQSYSQLNESLVQALAEASVKDGDSQIRGLLASQGITVKANEPAATPAPAAAQPQPEAKPAAPQKAPQNKK